MRSCGILLHISSLPSKYGIGALGKYAYQFVDFLKKSKQEYWQILPIGPTGYGDSPYQCYSAYAGNPLLIDIEELINNKLLSSDERELKLIDEKNIFSDYSSLFNLKNILLHTAYSSFMKTADEKLLEEFSLFCSENSFWLEDYSLFMALKYHFEQAMWTEWPDDIRRREETALTLYRDKLSDEIGYWNFVQFTFFAQYNKLKNYANEKGIKIYGDMPIYVSMDSSDIWASPKLFMLDDDLHPVKVAGCPPDDYSPTGQLWGNPLYNWDTMKKDGYKWWVSRIKYSQKLFDLIRIDHFRGFESFYAIPAEDKTAENGEWLKGPSMKLFDTIKKELGSVNLVAENLGFLTDSVEKMLKKSGYPGMNVLEFAFYGSEDSNYLPHNYIPNSVSYIGTHDNDTAIGWYKSLDKNNRKFAKKYMHLTRREGIAWGMIRTLYSSVSSLVIIQMQDFLELDSFARMNTPSTIGGGNWMWRMNACDINDRLAKKIKNITKLYFRNKKVKKIKLKENTELI
jgi:4-alpha-glucanotransferase